MPTTPIILAAAICFAVAVPLVAWAVGTRAPARRRAVLTNLQRHLPGTAVGTGPVSLADAPSTTGALLGRRLVPAALVRNLDRLHARAGRPQSWPMERVLVGKVLLLAVGALIGALVWLDEPSALRVVLGLAMFAFLWFLPELLLAATGSRRRQKILLTLPDTVDQLSIAVEAGLGLEGALRHVTSNTRGPLAEEIIRTLQDLQVGVPRRDAYAALAERVDQPDLRRFVRAITQAEQHGVSIARVLTIQAAEMRVKRRQRAEEKAMRIPVLVVFPLFFTIFPALLVVVLGPAIINILDAFTGGFVITGR